MKTIKYLIFILSLSISQNILASNDKFLGVWVKNYGTWNRGGYALTTIDFRKDGLLISCDGNWYSEKGKEVNKIFVNKYKIEKPGLMLLSGEFAGTSKRLKDIPLQYIIKKSGLSIKPFMAVLTGGYYKRLNAKEYKQYLVTLKRFGKGLAMPNQSIQERITKLSEKQSKIIDERELANYKPIGEAKVLAVITDFTLAKARFIIKYNNERVYADVHQVNLRNKIKKGDVIMWGNLRSSRNMYSKNLNNKKFASQKRSMEARLANLEKILATYPGHRVMDSVHLFKVRIKGNHSIALSVPKSLSSSVTSPVKSINEKSTSTSVISSVTPPLSSLNDKGTPELVANTPQRKKELSEELTDNAKTMADKIGAQYTYSNSMRRKHAYIAKKAPEKAMQFNQDIKNLLEKKSDAIIKKDGVVILYNMDKFFSELAYAQTQRRRK